MHRVGFFVFPDHEILDLAGPFGAFEAATRLSGRSLYRLEIYSCAGDSVASWGGVLVATKPGGNARLDTLVVCGGQVASMLKPGEVEAVARLARRASRIASICTGAFLLAEAGLLDCSIWLYGRAARDSALDCSSSSAKARFVRISRVVTV